MKASTALLISLVVAPVMSTWAQVQVGPQYRGFSFVGGGSDHTGGLAIEAHFPQGKWAWGIELEGTTGSELKYWTSAMFNAGLVIDRTYLYGSFGVGRGEERTRGSSDTTEFFGVGANFPLSRDLRADFSVDTNPSFDGYASTASLRYEIPTTAEKRRRRYSYDIEQPVSRAEAESAPTPSLQEIILDPVVAAAPTSMGETEPSQPTEEVVVTASAPVHPMKIAIQEGCNVVSVKVVDESEVWDLFCPSTLKRITVTI